MVQAGVGPYQTAPGYPQPPTVGADALSVAVAACNKSNSEAVAASLKTEGGQSSVPGQQVRNIIFVYFFLFKLNTIFFVFLFLSAWRTI